MNRWMRRHGLGVASPQYSVDFHLNRPVKCIDCGTYLHKTHFTKYYGHRCQSCYEQWAHAQTASASLASHVASDEVV